MFIKAAIAGRRETSYDRQQVRESIGLGVENHDCDATSLHVSLVFNAFVHRQKDFETLRLRKQEQLTIFLTCKAYFWHGAAFVTREVIFGIFSEGTRPAKSSS